MDVNVDSMVLELSRKCNMRCEHCLRGDAQERSMSDEVMERVCGMFDDVSALTIGGGEPSLMRKEIDRFLMASYRGKMSWGSAYIVTNGKWITEDVMGHFWRFFHMAEDGECSGLGFSYDKWHSDQLTLSQQRRRDLNMERAHDFFMLEGNYMNEFLDENGEPRVFKHSDLEWTDKTLFCMGRAEENGIGVRFESRYGFDIDSDDDREEVRISENSLYITYDGKIFSSCNLSYKEMDLGRDSEWYVTDLMKLNESDELVDEIVRYNITIKE